MEDPQERAGALVLVVDDSHDLRSLYELVLAEAGYRVVGASDGRAGLDLAGRLRPSVVVLDMMMPVMDGLEFLDRLPSIGEPLPRVVVSSGFPDFEPPARARGAHAFLRKPVMPDELVAAVVRAHGRRADVGAERAQAERVVATRERARSDRESILRRIDLDDAALRAMLEGVLAWLSWYEGFGTGLVDLLCGDKIYVEAGAAAKASVERELAFCSDVIDAGSSLVLCDIATHPIFASHKAAAHWGTRFYVGCPILTGGGCVLGTVCLIDPRPHPVGVVDMRLLEYIARRTGHHLETLAEGGRPAPFFEPSGLFEPLAISTMLDAHLELRTRVGLLLVRLARGGHAQLRSAADELREDALRGVVARWRADTLAVVYGGEQPSGAIDRMRDLLAAAGFSLGAIGLAEGSPAPDRPIAVSDVIAAAEAALARSSDLGASLVRGAVPSKCARAA